MTARLVLLALAVIGAGAALTGPPVPTTAPAQTAAVGPQPVDLTYRDLVMAASGCGTERWAIKTASDAQAAQVSTAQHQTTVAALRALHKPSTLPSNSRIRPTELSEYVIAGTLTGYKQESDGDYHLVIADATGHTMIVELADPRCVTGARFRAELTSARKAFAARYTPTGTMKNPHRAIRVRGIGFFDYLHGQTGVAPNGIELHPVLGLGFP